eukprot:g31202.t1
MLIVINNVVKAVKNMELITVFCCGKLELVINELSMVYHSNEAVLQHLQVSAAFLLIRTFLMYAQGLSIEDGLFNTFRVEAREVQHLVRSILYDNSSSFVCWFDNNVAIGLESTDDIALYLVDVVHYLMKGLGPKCQPFCSDDAAWPAVF